MKEKKSTRRAQADNTKSKLYDVAIEMITRKGYDNVTIQDICGKAEVSVGTFYHYFGAKEGIIIEIYKQVDQYFDEVFANYPKDANAIDQIIDFIGCQMSQAKTRGIDLVTQVYRSQIQAGNAFFISPDRSIPRILRQIVEDGQAKNQIRTDISAGEISSFILRFSRGIIYDWCLHHGDYDIQKTGRSAVAFMVKNCFAMDRICKTSDRRLAAKSLSAKKNPLS